MATLTYPTLADVPEDLREAVSEGDDGQFTVKVAPQAKIAEFRDNNIKVVQERDNLVAKMTAYEQVTGVSLEDFENGKLDDFASMLTSLRETKQRVEDGNLIESTSLEEAANQRVADAQKQIKEQLAAMAKDRDAHAERARSAEEAADRMKVENALRLVASDPDVAMLEKAVTHVLNEAQTVFRVEEGKIVPKSSDGTIIYGSDGINPMTMKEWLIKYREDNDFLFKGSQGGGAAGNDQKLAGRITQAELEAMSPQQRINYARKHGLA
jgi:hypothetical protein